MIAPRCRLILWFSHLLQICNLDKEAESPSALQEGSKTLISLPRKPKMKTDKLLYRNLNRLQTGVQLQR